MVCYHTDQPVARATQSASSCSLNSITVLPEDEVKQVSMNAVVFVVMWDIVAFYHFTAVTDGFSVFF